MSLLQCGSGVEHMGQGQSQQEIWVEHGHAGYEITGSTRLPLAKLPQLGYALVTYSLLQFNYGNPSSVAEEVSYPQRRIPNILLQFWNMMENLSVKLQKVVRVLIKRSHTASCNLAMLVLPRKGGKCTFW